ncbi:MAG: flagellar basal body-associated FliL family protein [Chitinispirillales bacterium]|jgi:flagellar basal body-associated protein FliL|nr:flagellar basal body-associated FliL family protein [Chitinispirillales bacterium]
MAEKDKKGKKGEAEAAPGAEGAAPEGDVAGKKDKGGNKLALIIVLLSIVAVQAVVVYFIVPRPENPEARAEKLAQDSIRIAQEAATKMGAVSEPIDATVNIAGTDGERYLKASIILEYDENNKLIGAELIRRAPKYKSLLIDHLASLTLMEVTDPNARDKIRKDLIRLINGTLPPKMGEVMDVHFKDYIIQ